MKRYQELLSLWSLGLLWFWFSEPEFQGTKSSGFQIWKLSEKRARSWSFGFVGGFITYSSNDWLSHCPLMQPQAPLQSLEIWVGLKVSDLWPQDGSIDNQLRSFGIFQKLLDQHNKKTSWSLSTLRKFQGFGGALCLKWAWRLNIYFLLQITLSQEASVSVFTFSDISTSDWCGRCGGGRDTLDWNTPGSPCHHFLCSSSIFLGNIKRCQTPGIHKWVRRLSGWDGNAS